MNIAKQIEAKIKDFPLGATFGYNELDIPAERFTTAAKAIERLLKKGVIKKLAKGTFYKPEQTVFGELKPDEKQVIKPYLFSNGKRIAYITGTLLYNQLGLTTQVPSTIKIASLTKRIYINKGTIKAKPVKSYVEVTESNYYLLGLLDAIKDLNNIPNINYENAIKRLSELLRALKSTQVKNMVDFALKYPPRVRALLGALLEETTNQNLEVLKRSLNPITVYKLPVSETALSTLKNWNIK